MASITPVRKRHTFISTRTQDRFRFFPCHGERVDPSQLRRLRLAYSSTVHVQSKYLVEGRAHGQDVVVEAHAENTRLLDLALVAYLPGVLVLRELGESCQFLEGELLELGHGWLCAATRGGSEAARCVAAQLNDWPDVRRSSLVICGVQTSAADCLSVHTAAIFRRAAAGLVSYMPLGRQSGTGQKARPKLHTFSKAA